jgi:hypothetical protein
MLDKTDHASRFESKQSSCFPIPLKVEIKDSSAKPSRLVSAMSFVTPTPKKHKSDQHFHPMAPISGCLAGYSRKNKSLGVLAENFINKFRPCVLE